MISAKELHSTHAEPPNAAQTNGRTERDQGGCDDVFRPREELRCLLAELAGTFALTLAAAGGEVIAAVSGGEVSHAARVVAPGLVVLALIYAFGNVSGAHFNPAVTFAFALGGAFRWRRVPGYWLAECCGAVVAALLLRWLFGLAGHLGATLPQYGARTAFVMEVALTWVLVTVILGTATRHRLIGPNAAIAVGATIALDGLFAGPISGASMNPARSLGPALVGGEMGSLWIYLLAPLLGAALAVSLTWVLQGAQKSGEDEAAGGDHGVHMHAHSSDH
jgi:aquaporin Z